MIPIIVLTIVFLLIAIRQVGNIKLQIWQIMLFGAVCVLLTGQISFYDAIKSINVDVMLFLFGMFVVGTALEESGYLAHLSYKFFKKAKTENELLLFLLFGFGILSALLMNDTIAIIGTPVVLLLARKHKISVLPLLLSLSFAVTIGSVISPIGNPQNLLIALNGNIKNPFIQFAKYLFLPTIINFFIAYFLIKIFYKESFKEKDLKHSQEPIKNHKLAVLSKISLMLVVILIFIKILFVILKINFDFKLTYIALVSMLPIVFLSSKRIEIIKRIDWHTLIFFASMFVLMASVWETGFFQSIINRSNVRITSIPAILIVSVILSQLISNVPLVALYLPMLTHSAVSTKELVSLAAGSTIAGNFLILGAASNVIIIQNSEKRHGGTVSFLDFAKIGVPLTILNLVVYWIYLTIVP
jgi:Na+/H+ antiporter NhaD/arsenite permease-like protein